MSHSYYHAMEGVGQFKNEILIDNINKEYLYNLNAEYENLGLLNDSDFDFSDI